MVILPAAISIYTAAVARVVGVDASAAAAAVFAAAAFVVVPVCSIFVAAAVTGWFGAPSSFARLILIALWSSMLGNPVAVGIT